MNRSELLENAISNARTAIFCQQHGDYEFPALQEVRKFTLDTLLAEQKRITGCDVCRGVKILHGTFSGTISVDGEAQMEVDSDGDVDFNFCPVCGRELTAAAIAEYEREHKEDL